ncbi:4Fe-4S dicluster domain-containing protein [Moorella naiadis (nom. illeg.)]|uniref:4Fe-4S dicluster domain-containing protein n=1 Tax=Moorella naiadis (nom. illeg.) TaxID=3093670 RepID=UPI003D9CAA83
MRLQVRVKKCTGCQNCAIVCAAEHKGIFTLNGSRLKITSEAGSAQQQIGVCRLCRNCLCVTSCTYKAFKIDTRTGVRYIDYDLCQNCQVCVQVCPFKAVHLDYTLDFPVVCDLCSGEPKCVQFCYFGALQLTTD